MERSEIALMSVVFIIGIAIFILWYTVPLILASSFNHNYPLVSLIIAIVPFVEIMTAIPIGFYVGNRNARRMGVGGMLMLISTPLVLLLFFGVGAIAMVFLALGSVATEISFGAYTYNVIKDVKIRYVGTVMFLSEAGGLIGASFGGFLLQYYNIYYIIGAVAALVAIAIVVFMKYLKPMKFVTKTRPIPFMSMLKEEGSIIHKFRHYMTILSIFMFMMGFLDWAVLLLVPFIILIHSANLFYGGIIYGIVNLPYGLGDLIGARAYKRSLKRKLIIWSTLSAVVLMLVMPALLHINVYILVVLCLVSLCMAIANVALSGYLLEKDRKQTAEFFSFETVTYEIGGIVGTILTGVTVAIEGIAAVSIIFAVMAGAFLFYFSFRSKDVK